MDILDSKIINIEGRLYINYFEAETLHVSGFASDDFPEAVDTAATSKATTGDQPEVKKLKHVIQCPTALFKYVIGTKGQTIKRLREETGTKIEIPRGQSNGGITVTAKSLESLDAAVTRIELLLSEKRWKQPFAHFVSIPLTHQAIKTGFQTFKKEVLEKCGGDKGVTEKLFQNKDKIHLTITPLTLLDDSECERAIEVMKRILSSHKCTAAKGIKISVSGIEYMNDDPQMVDVLYAKVSSQENPDMIQDLANYIAREFEAAGLAKKEYDHVKLHATVMNTIRTMEKSQPQQRGGEAPQKRETFDASNVLATFKEHFFGEFPLTEIHISKRNSASKDGYYDSLYVASI